MKMKSEQTPGDLVLIWTQKEAHFNLLPLQLWINSMQEGFLYGRSGPPDCIMLGIVKSHPEGLALATQLRAGREERANARGEITETA